MRVLLADSGGHVRVTDATLAAEDLASSIGGFDAWVVRSTKVVRVFRRAGFLLTGSTFPP